VGSWGSANKKQLSRCLLKLPSHKKNEDRSAVVSPPDRIIFLCLGGKQKQPSLGLFFQEENISSRRMLCAEEKKLTETRRWFFFHKM